MNITETTLLVDTGLWAYITICAIRDARPGIQNRRFGLLLFFLSLLVLHVIALL